jgi:AraC family transcriptional regulator
MEGTLEPKLPAGTFLGEPVRARPAGGFFLKETVYAPGLRLPRHAHANAYFSLTLRGAYTETCGRQDRDCGPATLIFHPEGEAHSDTFGASGGRLFNVEIQPAVLQRWEEIAPRAPMHWNGGEPSRLAIRLYTELDSPDSASPLAMEALALEILACACRAAIPRPDGAPRWLHRVEDLLRDRYLAPPTVSEVASVAGVHPAHLARVFRQRHGCTIAEYVRRLRIEHACRALLDPETPQAQIAQATGFADQSHFARAFKSQVGLTPGQFRAAHRLR